MYFRIISIRLSDYFLSGECVTSSVLSCHNKNLKWWTSVTAQFYLESKRKYILKVWGQANPKDEKEKRGAQPNFGSSFYVFSSSPGLPWARGSPVCFTWAPHSGPRTFLCSIFEGFSLPCLLATTILDSFFLF